MNPVRFAFCARTWNVAGPTDDAETRRELKRDNVSVAEKISWLTDLLEWYDEFNDVRNALFTDRGLLGSDEDPILPASTGISLDNAEGAYCAMDLLAVLGKEGVVARHQAGGEQGSAYDYGSAFSRAVTARTLAGKTVLVSGTAAIDEAGYTEHLDDIDNILSALQHLKYNRHEVILFHVVDKDKELEFEYDNRPYMFIDMESGEKVKLRSNEVKQLYRKQMDEMLAKLRMKCLQYKIDFIPTDIRSGYRSILQSYLVKRSKMGT